MTANFSVAGKPDEIIAATLLVAKRRKSMAQAHKDVAIWQSTLLEAELEATLAAEEQRKVESLAVLHRYLARAVEVAGTLLTEDAPPKTLERVENGISLAEVRPYCAAGHRVCIMRVNR